ncbi:MAG: single-stranded DNA-binding protein [Clostridia bacterium]|nr:single-stranded DNA-binding protein [Clostridia bacterium]
MNKIVIAGRLVEKPELKQTNSNKSVASIKVAVNRPFTKDKADFFTCIAWEKTAENIVKYFEKGDQIIVSGYLYSREWETPDGNKRYATEINIEEFDFGSKKKSDVQETPKPTPIPEDADLPF